MIEEEFNRLTVLSMEKVGKYHKCKCVCRCGTVVLVLRNHLLSGHTKSCGCLNRESLSARRKSHGLSRTPLYDVWQNMVKRCSDKAFGHNKNDYFDRGIQVCAEWAGNPKAFVDWGENHRYEKGLQIDRINNDLGYSPDNCRFVTPLENSHNQRLLRQTNTSGYSGVSFLQARRKFQSRVYSGKLTHLGLFKTPWEACEARNKFIIENNLPHKIQERRDDIK